MHHTPTMSDLWLSAPDPSVPSRMAPGGVAHGSRRTPTSKFGGYIALTKPRIIELLLITTVPTMVLAQGGWPRTSLVLITLLGGTLAAGGANAINMVVDRDIDKLMPRTQGRPLVTGLLQPRQALVFAIGLEVLAFAVLWVWANLLSAVLALSATLFYVFIYTLWLKRTSTQNIVIGGAAGASAAAGGLGRRRRTTSRCAGGAVRGDVPLDAAALLGAGDQVRRRLSRRQRADAAGGGPRCRSPCARWCCTRR